MRPPRRILLFVSRGSMRRGCQHLSSHASHYWFPQQCPSVRGFLQPNDSMEKSVHSKSIQEWKILQLCSGEVLDDDQLSRACSETDVADFCSFFFLFFFFAENRKLRLSRGIQSSVVHPQEWHFPPRYAEKPLDRLPPPLEDVSESRVPRTQIDLLPLVETVQPVVSLPVLPSLVLIHAVEDAEDGEHHDDKLPDKIDGVAREVTGRVRHGVGPAARLAASAKNTKEQQTRDGE